MTLTLAQYRTRILALLDDPSLTRYTNDQVDMACSLALNDYSNYRPILRTYQLDTSNEKVMDLPTSFSTRHITRVQLYNADPNLTTDLIFIARLIDEIWTLEIPGMIYPSGNILTISYTDKHTVENLDSALVTTIDDDNLFATGAAGYAAQIRAVSRSETINMQPAVQKQLMELSKQFLNQFFTRLQSPASVSFAPFTMPQ